MRMKKLLIILFLCGSNIVCGQYEPPKATVEPLTPRGIRISVPHEDGMTLVAFHVKINENFDSLEAGTIARDIIRAKNNRWTYQDRTTRLKLGDIVYYWIHVVYDGLGYNLLDQQHQVTEFFSPDGGDRVRPPTISTEFENRPCAPTETKLIETRTGQRRDVCAGQLLLNDQFDLFNQSLWRKHEKFTSSPDYAFVVYRNDERNVKISNGNLEIKPTLVKSELGEDFIRSANYTLPRCTGERGSIECQREALGAYILPPVFSGLVDTKNTFAFIYGKVEIRAKLPRGDWIYPILSLEKLDKHSSEPRLRVASSTGNSVLRNSNNDDFSGHVVRSGAIGGTSRSASDEIPSLPRRYSDKMWSDDYHIYEIEWRREKIFSRVDGIEFGNKETSSPFDKPFFLTLGVGVGGHEEFPDSSTSDGYAKPWRNVGSKALFDFFNATDQWSRTWDEDSSSLKIDYIRVWAL